MAFVPVTDTSGNVTLGTSDKPMQLAGRHMFASGTYHQRYQFTGTFSSNSVYTVIPSNTLIADTPVLIIGRWDFNAFPWFHIYSFTYRNIQQNGSDSRDTAIQSCTHGNAFTAIVGNTTSYYADGVAPLRIRMYGPYQGYTSVFATVTHDVYRIGV